jgi:Domain of unknown function (DUF4124)
MGGSLKEPGSGRNPRLAFFGRRLPMCNDGIDMGAPEPASSAVYYRWTDAKGTTHLVDSLDKVPEESRPALERVTMAVAAAPVDRSGWLGPIHIEWESFAAGFAVALLLGFLFVLARRSKRAWLELGVLVMTVAVIVGIYLGWAQQNAAASKPKPGAHPVQVDASKKADDGKLFKRLYK